MARRALTHHEEAKARLGSFSAYSGSMKNFLRDETALELSEYAIATALVTISVASAFTSLGDAVVGKLNDLIGRVNG